MRFADFIERVKDQCPDFGHVAHLLMSTTSYDYPAALLSPVESRGESPRINIPGAFSQDVELIVGVFIVLDRRQDGPADHGNADLLDRLSAAVKAALINWQPDWALAPITYAGGRLAPYDAGIVTWREDFAVQFEVRYT